MKNILAIMMMVCLMVSMFCLTAYAADTTADDIADEYKITITDPSTVGEDGKPIEKTEGTLGTWWGTASASMLGSGSVSMIVSLAAVAVLVVICIAVYKKKAATDGKNPQDKD